VPRVLNNTNSKYAFLSRTITGLSQWQQTQGNPSEWGAYHPICNAKTLGFGITASQVVPPLNRSS